MKTYKLYAAMTGEFEIFRTDAPESVVTEYARACATDTLPDNDPNLFFEQKEYSVDFIACQYDDDTVENLSVDYEIDLYDYLESDQSNISDIAIVK